jgi:undecaprenyl diphosphate synthase
MVELEKNIDVERLPRHIAVIMDGNGRWAKKRGGIRLLGHRNGAKAVREVTEACAELGVNYLTVFAFSSENWKRPGEEVSGLMKLLVDSLDNEFSTLLENGVRLNAIGDLSRLPINVYEKLQNTINNTADGKRMCLTLALSYSGQWDIIQAAKAFATDVKQNDKAIEDLDIDLFKSYLSTKAIPDPELIIRTSGELRLSNYLLFQMAYAELYFTKTLWPDFKKKELYKAILDYQSRERRFGKTSEQL